MDSVKKVRANCKELAAESSCQELINSYFIYARDFGKNSVKNLDSSRKSTVIMKLIQLSIEWVSFVCDDCIRLIGGLLDRVFWLWNLPWISLEALTFWF